MTPVMLIRRLWDQAQGQELVAWRTNHMIRGLELIWSRKWQQSEMTCPSCKVRISVHAQTRGWGREWGSGTDVLITMSRSGDTSPPPRRG